MNMSRDVFNEAERCKSGRTKRRQPPRSADNRPQTI
jgi:hypothetical protein